MKKLALMGLIVAAGAGAAVVPVGLKCEYRVDPLAVDAARPRLSWVLESAERGERQTAYRVIAASSADLLKQDRGDVWDSGRVASAESTQIEYAGKALASHQRVFWKVRVWDRAGTPSAWSAGAEWSMGILKPEEWKANWIALRRTPNASGPLPMFRKQVTIPRPVRRSIVYVSGAGFFELYVNGKRVGDDVLAPLWTNFRKSVHYVAYDITSLVHPGKNVFAAMVGNGFYNVPGGRYAKFIGTYGPPALLMHARLEYENGTSGEVVTNTTWKADWGPVVFSCIHGGEDYDARAEQAGWTEADFDDSKWKAPSYDGAPGGDMVAQMAPPVKVMERFKTVRVTTPAPGIRVFDLGQNFAGWPRIKVRGAAGASIKMITAELLHPDGTIDQTSASGRNNQGPGIWFTYTLKGAGIEEWHPRFSYTGFRYVQVEGDAEVVSMEGEFVHSSAARAGGFTSSSALFNRIEKLVDYAVRTNLQSVLTDCPHREKLGWLEVVHLMGPSIIQRFDAPNFYTKVARDTREAQLDNGLVPDIAPEYVVFRDGFRDSPEWGSAAAEVPWLLYRWYGDKRALADSYATMARYAAYLASKADKGVLAYGLGDWYDIGPGAPGASKLTPKGITATATYYRVLDILSNAAALLGKTADAARYRAQANQVRAAFHTAFFNKEGGYYGTGSQTAQSMALVCNLVPASERARVLAQLEADIRKRGNQQTAGDVGYRYLIQALATNGRSDILWDINTRTTPPSYGHQIAQGVTSLAEAWDANRLSSQNHCMLGHIQEWFIASLGGIQQADGSSGWKSIVIKPAVVGELKNVDAHYDSVRGRIESKWRIEGRTLKLDVKIPVGATAAVHVPSAAGAKVHNIEAGSYSFTSELAKNETK